MQHSALNHLLLISSLASASILISTIPYKKIIVLLLFSCFLSVAPPTASEQDFDAYKTGFENIELISEYPYVVSSTNLTAERGFFWYMVIFHSFTNQFNVFLILNFLTLSILNAYFLKKIGFQQTDLNNIMLYALPALIPLIFYWSPRSAPSIPLILASYYFLSDKKYLISLFILLLATIIHSQYIPFILVLSLTMIGYNLVGRQLILLSTLFSILTLGILKYGINLIRLIPAGDIFSVAFNKLHYIEALGTSAGIRPSGIMIILIDLIYLILIRHKIYPAPKDKIINIIDISIIFSLTANLFFISDSHVSGRIARFSDFFIITCAFPYLASKFMAKKYIRLSLMLAFISMMAIYSNIYYIEIS
jgi:hypothetical protein